MLKIRLQRVGRKHEPVFRIVVTDSKTAAKKYRRFHEVIGAYDARRKDYSTVDVERAKYWISKGAQPSVTIHNLLVDKKAIDAKKIQNIVAKKEEPKEEPKAEAAPEVKEEAPAEVVEEAAPEVAETPAEEATPASEEESAEKTA